MTRTFQPCDECRGTNLQTREYPTYVEGSTPATRTGPPTMQRLCDLCFDDRQEEYREQFEREPRERAQRIADRVGAFAFDAMLVSLAVVGVFALVRLFFGWPSW